MIKAGFGDTETLLEKLAAEAVGHFASGWAWLVLEGDQLRVTSYHDADTPIVHDGREAAADARCVGACLLYRLSQRAAEVRRKRAQQCDHWEFVAQNLDGEGAARADQAQV
jgi:Fe-Mn family superoxide dismutase